MKVPPIPEFAAVIGIDWGDAKHDVCLRSAGGKHCEYDQIPHTVEAIAAWAGALRKRFPDQPLAVAVELSKGPLIYALQQYPWLTLFPVNPGSLARYRQTFTPSNAKDDPTDAFLLLDLFTRHRERFTPVRPDSTAMRALGQMVEARITLRGDIVRVSNRLTSALKDYYPQALTWFAKKDTELFCDFLERWSTPAQARKARRSTLERFFRQHNVRYAARIDQRIEAIQQLTPLTTDPGVLQPAVLLVESLVRQLRLLLQTRARYDRAISETASQLDEHRIFASFPGAATVYAPRLMVAFGENRERFPSAAHAQRAFAIAPVIQRSGKKSWVHWRFRCNKSLRQTLVEWSALSIPHSFWAKAYYQQQRDKGSSHQAALRALAFKWTRILFRCWHDRVPYNENAYLDALRTRRSPLLKYIAAEA